MSGSGKGLLGLWLYRTGQEWALKEGPPRPAPSQVRILPSLLAKVLRVLEGKFLGNVFSDNSHVIILKSTY
jgi:hypothetical protein